MGLRCRMCSDCLRHLRTIGKHEKTIARQAERIRSLEKRLEKLGRSADEVPFGLSTPSSKIVLKPTAPEENRARKGGRPKGHVGRGRKAFRGGGADRTERVPLERQICPDCGVELSGSVEFRTREYLEMERHRLNKVLCEMESCRCPKCRARVTAKPAGVLPGELFGNSLLARLAVAHYLDNQTFGFLERHLGIGKSAIIQSLQRLADLVGPLHPMVVEEVRRAAVLFADETTWRSDGANGYVWATFCDYAEAYLVRFSRASTVAIEMFGQKPLPGVAITDRYAGYNHIPIRRQYCYAHLKRDLEDLVRENPRSREVATFVDALLPLLCQAMKLRGKPIEDDEYYRRAQVLHRQILDVCQQPARLPAVQKFQNLFRQQPQHLFLWVEDRAVPAENNRAERGVRPVVIARKISQGTQSDKGMRTMEVLLTVLRTLQLRTGDAETALVAILDAVARDPTVKVEDLLPPIPKAATQAELKVA